MEISRVDKQTIKIEHSKGQAVNFSLAAEGVDIANSFTVGPLQVSDFAKPGEYELNDMFLFVSEQSHPLTGQGNVFKVAIEGVSVCYFYNNIKEYEKSMIDEIGNVDVLVIDSAVSKSLLKSLVSDFDPKMIINIDQASEKSISELTDLTITKSASRFKFKEEDFKTEEFTVQLCYLA